MLKSAAVNYKELFRKVERTLARIEKSEDLPVTLTMILKSLVDEYREEFGITGGRVYQQKGNAYVLTAQYGSGPKLNPGFKIPVTYAPMRLLRKLGYIYMGPDDPGFDPRLEEKIGVRRFAAIGIGDDAPWVSFLDAPPFRLPPRIFVLGAHRSKDGPLPGRLQAAC